MFSLIALIQQLTSAMHSEATLFSRDPLWSPINGCGYKAVRINTSEVRQRPGI